MEWNIVKTSHLAEGCRLITSNSPQDKDALTVVWIWGTVREQCDQPVMSFPSGLWAKHPSLLVNARSHLCLPWMLWFQTENTRLHTHFYAYFSSSFKCSTLVSFVLAFFQRCSLKLWVWKQWKCTYSFQAVKKLTFFLFLSLHIALS